MKTTSGIRKFILLFLTMAIIAGGLFFDVREMREVSDSLGTLTTISSKTNDNPHRSSDIISARDISKVAALEIRDLRAAREDVNSQEIPASAKRIVVFSLILCLLLSLGAFYTSVLPSIFPWTSLVISRFIAVSYIHLKDGKK